MTIQKLSSGSKKNCRFFCVCRDLAGFVGQNVLEQRRYNREMRRHTQTSSRFAFLQTLDMYQHVSGHLLQHFPDLISLRFNELQLFGHFTLKKLVKPCHVFNAWHFKLCLVLDRGKNGIAAMLCFCFRYNCSLPGELYNGFTKAHISDLLILLYITGMVKQNLLLFLKEKKRHSALAI